MIITGDVWNLCSRRSELLESQVSVPVVPEQDRDITEAQNNGSEEACQLSLTQRSEVRLRSLLIT